MPLARRATRTVLTATVVGLAMAGVWITSHPDPAPPEVAGPTPTPTPTPTPPAQGEVRLPTAAATVLPEADDAALALAASETFFVSAPVVVVAPAGDVEAQQRAAVIAVELGAPLLLAPAVAGDGAGTGTARPTASPAAPDGADAVRAEVDRLDAVAAVTVGDVTADLGVAVVRAPAPAAPAPEQTTDPTGPPTASPTASPTAVPTPGPATSPTAAPASAPHLLPGPTPTDDTPTDDTANHTAHDAAPDDDLADALPETVPPETTAGGLALTTGDPAATAAVATARAAGLDVLEVPGGDPRVDPDVVRAVAAADPSTVVGLGPAFGTAEELAWTSATAATGVELPGGGQVLFTGPSTGRRMVALYGSPDIPALGLLGEQDVTASIARAQGLAAEYQALTTDVVVPAFEIIATIADRPPGDDGNYSNELPADRFVPWIEAALDAGVYVVLDLQPGRTDFLTQARQYESLLRYPNVGLALDPEWRLAPDQVHLRQIGSVGIDEVNAVAHYLADLTRTNRLPQKLLILHQFQQRMIAGREALDTTDPAIQVLLHVDGQGTQAAKAGTWANLQQGAPANVVWGWKNFLDEDVPMATPADTYQVQPTPHFVSYQ